MATHRTEQFLYERMYPFLQLVISIYLK